MSSSELDTLVLIIETHALAWENLLDAYNFMQNALTPALFVKQICAFVNTYQLLSEGNRLAVLAVQQGGASVIFSDLHLIINPNSSASATPAAQVLHDKLAQILTEAEGAPEARKRASPACMSSAISKALCMLSRTCARQAGGNAFNPRILVLNVCEDGPGQYIACMNAIFSAQRLNITIDGMAIAEKTSSFFQQTFTNMPGSRDLVSDFRGGTANAAEAICITFLQKAAHMTGGLYLRPKSPSALLQYLYTAFSVNTASRKFLQLPPSQGLDFKATCFCHAKIISIGFVCSVCLSVFCENQAECSTCGTDFRGPLKAS